MAEERKYKAKKILECPLKDKYDLIDYKNIQIIKKFISTRGRIMPTSKTGICKKCQARLTVAVKNARHIGFLPFTQYV